MHGTVTEVIVLNHIRVMLYGGEHSAYQSLTLHVFCYHPIIYQYTHILSNYRNATENKPRVKLDQNERPDSILRHVVTV